MRHIFNQTAHACAAADEPRFVPSSLAPPDYCVHTYPHCESIRERREYSWTTARPVQFDQNLHERIFLARHLQSARILCDPAQPAACDQADIVVVPSPYLHLFAVHGFAYAVPLCASQAMWAPFLTLVRRAYFDGRARPPLIVLNIEQPFDNRGPTFFDALVEQPRAFQSALLVTNRLSRIGLQKRRKFGRAWVDDGLVELARREALVRAQHASLRGVANVGDVDFGGPLLVSVPAATGVSRAVRSWSSPAGAFSPAESLARRDIAILADADVRRSQGKTADGRRPQYVRTKIQSVLKKSGANCTRGLSTCAQCVRGAAECPLNAPERRSTFFSQLLRSHTAPRGQFTPPIHTCSAAFMKQVLPRFVSPTRPPTLDPPLDLFFLASSPDVFFWAV